MLGPARWCFFEGYRCWILSDGHLQTVLLDGIKDKCPKPVLMVRTHWYFNINAVHVLQKIQIQENIFWVHIRVLWSLFPLHWKPNILLVNYDSRWQHQMSVRELRQNRQVGGFQDPGVCLQAFPSFLPHPLPALLLTLFFAQSFTLVPRFLLLKRTETLATQVST